MSSSLLLVSMLLAASYATWVPATYKTVHDNSRRDLNATFAAALQPTHSTDLLYIDDSAPTQNMAINVNAEHATNQYIVIEEFRDLISKLTCTPDAGNANLTNVRLAFNGPDVFNTAQQYWASNAELKDGQFLFITHDPDCSADGQRVVFCSDNIQFDPASSSATIAANELQLGYDADASTSLTVSGGPYQSSDKLSKQAKRGFLGFGTPDDDDYSSGTKSIDFPMDIEINQKTLISSDLLTLICFDCHLTGELSPAFQYKFLTDKSTLAEKVLTGNWDEIVKQATLNISATKDISTALDFQVQTTQTVDLECTYPYGECGVSIDGVGIGSKSNSLLGDGGFKVGPFQLNLFAALGITIEAHMAADVSMNWTASAEIPAGQFDSFDFLDVSKSQNTFHPELQAGTPSVSLDDIQACITLGLGGQFNAGVAVDVAGGNHTAVDINVDVFLPKVVFCADDNKKSNDKCNADGLTHVHHYNSTLTVGTELSGEILGKEASTGDSLEAHFSLFDKCDVQSSAAPAAQASAVIISSNFGASATITGDAASVVAPSAAVSSVDAKAVASVVASGIASAAEAAATPQISPKSTPCSTGGQVPSTTAADPASATLRPNGSIDSDKARRYARLARYAKY